MDIATLVLVIDPNNENRVLLAIKQRKIGTGKWNGYGGKPEPEDTGIRSTAVRELFQESGKGIIVAEEDLIPCAIIDFSVQENGEEVPTFQVSVYTTTVFTGTAVDSDEAKNPTWFLQDEIPYDDMLPGDRIFIPKVLAGETFTGIIKFSEGFKGFHEEPRFTPVDRNSLGI